MRRALAYTATVPLVAALLTAVQVSAGLSRAFRETVPHPVLAAFICWLLWAPIVPGIALVFRRWVDPGGAGRRAAGVVAITAFLAAGAHATLTSLVGLLLAPIFGPGRPSLVAEIAGLLPKSVFAALLFALATLAVESLAWRRRAELRAVEAEAARLGAELDALRRQLAPHLVFNALNALVVELRKGNVGATEDGLIALARLLRRLLDMGRRGSVPLREEIDFLEQYLAIARLRFRDTLAVSIEAGPDVLEAQVPALLLQPLVENALEHGMASGGRRLRVEVTARRDGDRLVVCVADDGAGLLPGFVLARDARVGLSTVVERLRLGRPGPGRLSVAPGFSGGVVARIELPFARGVEREARRVA